MKNDDKSMRISAVAAPLRQKVAQTIRRAIIAGRFEPGQRLVEKDLCELLGVSRPSLREALRQVEAEGFIETIPNRGPIVVKLDAEAIRHLYDVLSILEAQAARLFSMNATDEELAALDRAVGEIAAKYAGGTVEEKLEAKNRFYDILFAGARNPMLSSVFASVQGRIDMVLRVALSASDRLRETADSLRHLLAAIAERDSEEAFARSRSLVERAAEETLRHVSEKPRQA